MKKETEVLQAAADGNVTKLECLFEQRQSKVFAGLFKGPNINWRNENGCTALHLAALNGHAEAVIFLLHNDASANTPDNAGSFPLHLAAFNGHAPVARILIERGPSKAQVNEQNMTGDTALHVAAQYNHHIVMDVLLKHHADSFFRNAKNETALDLAAQYGRFTAVQMLLFKDLAIIKQTIYQHSPLHLAARNGHLKVVQLLVDSGMSIDTCCEMGTALHTAALFGKVEVAKYLLRKGVNIEIKNDCDEKVLDLLCKIPSKLSQQITALIYEHSGLSDDKPERPRTQIESCKSRKLPTYDYVPGFAKKSVENDNGGIHSYAVVQGLGNPGNRISGYSGEFDLVSLTGKEESSPYSLVSKNFQNIGEVSRTELTSNVVDDDLQGDYVEVDLTNTKSRISVKSTESYDIPPNFDNQKIQSKPFDEDIDSFNNNEQHMLSDAAYNLLGIKPLSQSVPINMHNFNIDTSQTYIDSYDNVALKNIPVSTDFDQNQYVENYDNVNLCQTVKECETDIHNQYDNVNLSHGQAKNSYDNVHIKNVPIAIEYEENQHKDKEKKVKQRRTVTKKNKLTDDPSITSKSDIQSIDTSIPKETRKVKQTRTSVKNVQDGYRMSNIGKKTVMNESYEWNKIDKFVSELEIYAEDNSIRNENVNSETYDVSGWLNSLGLNNYEPIFLSNGFDDIAFLNGVICNEDLIELGIIDSEHRRTILEATLNLPKTPVIGDADFPFPKDIKEWLRKLKLLDYTRRFIHYGYDNMERVRVIWELELVSILQITIVGHYKRMLTSLGNQAIKVKDKVLLTQKQISKDIFCKKSVDYVDDSMDVAKQLLETAENLKIERLNRSLSNSAAKSADECVADFEGNDSDNLSDNRQSSEAEWIYPSERLLNGSVSYIMEYLGSHPVKEVNGITSTYNACSKMKIISKNIHKMPSVTLSISVRGIDYIDSNSKMIIGQYAINNISYCAQDPDSLNIFAYITRDEITRKHYCHVLRVPTIELADEIIITIGQCFELAYQLYLKKLEKIKSQSLSSDEKPQLPPRTASLINKKHNRKPPPQPEPFIGKVSL